jgi:hypothetical protein
MSNINKFCVVLMSILIIVAVGCRSKQPAASTPESKANDGPLLAPPQKPTEPAAMPKAQPTEGEPAGKSTSNGATAAPGNTQVASQPTEGDPEGKARPSGSESANNQATQAAAIKANLASLSIADRALAEKQKVCPVSGEPLGAMGAPKKISVAGRELFICCPSCEDTVAKEPAKYLAKVGLSPATGK